MAKIGELLKGRVIKIVKGKTGDEVGALLKLPTSEVGFLPIGECKRTEEEFVKKVTDVVKVGDEVEVRVIKYNRKLNKITLSLFRANSEVHKKIQFDKQLQKFLKTSGDIQAQIKKNTDRKQGNVRKKINKSNNN